mmetsp:Transcript_8385/g.16898  ORF Transcript_8385/g.16898 Transcript_8385/m.16898 type:complete len:97 (+) Transcript_8385:966-1256(+)
MNFCRREISKIKQQGDEIINHRRLLCRIVFTHHSPIPSLKRLTRTDPNFCDIFHFVPNWRKYHMIELAVSVVITGFVALVLEHQVLNKLTRICAER